MKKIEDSLTNDELMMELIKDRKGLIIFIIVNIILIGSMVLMFSWIIAQTFYIINLGLKNIFNCYII